MKMPKMIKQRKGNALGAVVGVFTGLLIVGMVTAFLFVFLAQVLAMDVVSADGNSTGAIESVRDAAGIGVDFLPIVVLGGIMFALLGYFIGRKLNM